MELCRYVHFDKLTGMYAHITMPKHKMNVHMQCFTMSSMAVCFWHTHTHTHSMAHVQRKVYTLYMHCHHLALIYASIHTQLTTCYLHGKPFLLSRLLPTIFMACTVRQRNDYREEVTSHNWTGYNGRVNIVTEASVEGIAL